MKIPSRGQGLLTTEERTLLRSLIGQDVFIAFSPWINAAFDRFHCGPLSFALRSSPGFLVLDPVWEEDEAMNDFGWLTVRVAERAKDVQYSPEGIPAATSTLSLAPSSPIARIALLRKHNAPDWVFDTALLFEHEERLRYLISYEPSAFQHLTILFTDLAIDQVIRDLPREPV